MPHDRSWDLIADPAESLVDTPATIRVTGVPPGAPVLLQASLRDRSAHTWHSHAVLRADPRGEVDVARDPPLAGSYAGVEPMGLIWSAAPSVEANSPGPFEPPQADPLTVTITATLDGGSARADLTRRVRAPGVARSGVEGPALAGTFFTPPHELPAPGVVVLGGSGGAAPEDLAALLASHGYAALALACFGADGLPPELVEVPLEYFEEAVRWLQAQQAVDAAGLGLVGRSRGGELALLLASQLPEVDAVVGYVPSGVALWGVTGQGWSPRPAWAYRGHDLPVLGPPAAGDEARAHTGEPFAGTPLILPLIDHADPNLQAAAIPVERIEGEVLLISGEDDQMWPSTQLADVAYHRLRQADRPCEHQRYDGAGHLISYPYIPTTVTEAVHPVTGRSSTFGGTPQATASANADSWPRVLEFLNRCLARGTPATHKEGERAHGQP